MCLILRRSSCCSFLLTWLRLLSSLKSKGLGKIEWYCIEGPSSFMTDYPLVSVSRIPSSMPYTVLYAVCAVLCFVLLDLYRLYSVHICAENPRNIEETIMIRRIMLTVSWWPLSSRYDKKWGARVLWFTWLSSPFDHLVFICLGRVINVRFGDLWVGGGVISCFPGKVFIQPILPKVNLGGQF